MIYTVVGVAHREGDFQGKSYDNFHIFAQRDAIAERNETGLITKEFKIPSIHFQKNQIFIGDMFDSLDITYDIYKRIKSFK